MSTVADGELAIASDESAEIGWPRVPLAQLCTIEARIVDPTALEFRDLPHVSGENIESGSGRLLAIRSATEDRMTSGKYLFDGGVLLYSKLRPYLRKVTVADFRGLCSADMYPIRFDRNRVDLNFGKYALLAEEFTSYAVRESERARMPKLNREQLLRFKLLLPPLAEQERIVGRLTEQMAEVERARAAAVERLAAAEGLPAAYLRDAFAGTFVQLASTCNSRERVTKIARSPSRSPNRIVSSVVRTIVRTILAPKIGPQKMRFSAKRVQVRTIRTVRAIFCPNFLVGYPSALLYQSPSRPLRSERRARYECAGIVGLVPSA